MKPQLLLLAALALLASCTNNENTPETGNDTLVPVTLNAGIVQTRATNNQWTAGDAIGLCLFATGTNETAEQVFNYRYNATTGGANTAFSPATTAHTAYYPTTGAQVDLLAYYPYSTALSTDGSLSLDVSNQKNLPAIDLMSATTTANKNHPNATLSFTHRLTRLVFALSGKGSVSTAQLAGATLTISGMKTQARYNLYTNTLDEATDPATTTPKTTTPEASTPQDITVPLNAAGTQGTAIVLPREAAPGVSYIITLKDGSRFTAQLSDTQELKAGTSNLFRISLNPQNVTITATITDWTEMPETDLNTSSVEITTAADATTDFPAGSHITLWPGESTGDGIPFTLNANGQWDTETPLYWEQYPAATTTFHALYTPETTPAGNRAPDVMAATAPTERFAPVSLAFSHLMAQLNIVLKAGKGMTQTEVETASVVLPQAIATYTLEGITLTPGTDRKDITLTGSAADRHTLLVPQTIDAGTPLLALTIGRKSYSLNATDRNGLFESGKSYTINVTVNQTEINATVSINPWQEGTNSEGDAGMEI